MNWRCDWIDHNVKGKAKRYGINITSKSRVFLKSGGAFSPEFKTPHIHSIPNAIYSCCCSVSQSCPALCNPMDCSMQGFPVPYYLPGFAQILVYWVGDAIYLSHPLLPLSPFAFLKGNQMMDIIWKYGCADTLQKSQKLLPLQPSISQDPQTTGWEPLI